MNEKPKGEVDNCRYRLIKYCKGLGADMGCGVSTIRVDAIGIDLYSPGADLKLDARILKEFPEEHFDYIFSSHLLEEIEDTEAVLRRWLKILKPGGNIVLYQADKNKYFPFSDPRCNKNHKHHFSWEDLWEIFKKIGETELIHHNDTLSNEWSFELVIKKTCKEEEKLIDTVSNEGISILVPTYKRPQSMEEFSLSVNNTAKNHDKIEILFGINEGDEESVKKCIELKNLCKIQINYVMIANHPSGKVNLSFLWNQIYKHAANPIFGFFGDDVIFRTPGWDEEVQREFLNDHMKLISCNDVHIQKGKKAILFFTHKEIHDLIGFYMNENFYRWFMDSWWDVVFQKCGKLIYREDIITEHRLPVNFKERADETYKRMDGLQENDKITWDTLENVKSIKNALNIIKPHNTVSEEEIGTLVRYLKNS